MGDTALQPSGTESGSSGRGADGLGNWLGLGFGAAFIGFVASIAYFGLAEVSAFCGVFESSCAAGGQAESAGAAVLIGWALLAVGGVVSLCVRTVGRRLMLLAGYEVVYVASLVALWYASPAIWGPMHCQWPC